MLDVQTKKFLFFIHAKINSFHISSSACVGNPLAACIDVVLLRQLGRELDKGFWWYLLFLLLFICSQIWVFCLIFFVYCYHCIFFGGSSHCIGLFSSPSLSSLLFGSTSFSISFLLFCCLDLWGLALCRLWVSFHWSVFSWVDRVLLSYFFLA